MQAKELRTVVGDSDALAGGKDGHIVHVDKRLDDLAEEFWGLAIDRRDGEGVGIFLGQDGARVVPQSGDLVTGVGQRRLDGRSTGATEVGSTAKVEA